MKYFVHLKDDVAFAYHESSTEVDIPGDNIIEVDENVESYLSKKYVNGSFIEAPIIKYAILDNSNTVISIEKTIFSSDAEGKHIITDPNVKVLWKWNGSEFVSPETVEPLPTINVGSTRITVSDEIPAISSEQIAQIESERIQRLSIETAGESSMPVQTEGPWNDDDQLNG
jgi:hypothetical protein